MGLFLGSCTSLHYKRIWKTWAPPKCKFFMWLVAQNKCWTADRLAKRGLHHPPRCPLCDQEFESISHLLLTCVLSREFWYKVLRLFGLHSLAPKPTNTCFLEWWEIVAQQVTGLNRKGLNSLIILGCCMIWKHRNKIVFDGKAPSLSVLLQETRGEGEKWLLAGAKRLSFLAAAISGT